MKIGFVDASERKEWDGFAARQPAFALMQSWGWGEFKRRMGWQVYRIAVKEQNQMVAGAQMFIKSLPAGVGSVAYVPRGPLVDWMDLPTCGILLKELNRIARKARAVFLKVEPPLIKNAESHARLRDLGFHSSENTNQPRNTIVMDIQPDEETLLEQMRKKTRQYIRKAEREGLTVRAASVEDLPAITNLLHRTGQREGIAVRGLEYFQAEWETFHQSNQIVFHLAELDGKLVAVRSAQCFGRHTAEFHAGADRTGLQNHANYLLVWEGVKWAKRLGCITYDFWGIPDVIGSSLEQDEQTFSDQTEGLWGVYRFKSGFCRNIVSYVGAYDYIYRPVLYRILMNRLFNRDAVEKSAVWLESRR